MVWGCFEGAPHSNPLDPRSDNFENAGSVTGTVTQLYPPFSGLSGVELRLSPGDYLTTSDGAGRFDFLGVEEGRYTISAELDGFIAEEQVVDVEINQQAGVIFRMDGVPFIRELDIQTFHLSRWWPPPVDQFWLDISARVDDPDGIADIEAVFVDIPIVDLADTLLVERDVGQFSLRLREEDIGVSVEAIAGHDINITVRDREGEQSVLMGQRISRIIGETPVANNPTGLNEAESNPPAFFWSDVRVNYPFTYQIDVARVDENIPTPVQTIPGISSDSLSVQATVSLPAGQYIWTVSIVDEFGNQSRSREAGFIIP